MTATIDRPSLAEIVTAACDELGVLSDDVCNTARRTRGPATARAIVAFVGHNVFGYTLGQVAAESGFGSAAGVSLACVRVIGRAMQEPEIAEAVHSVIAEFDFLRAGEFSDSIAGGRSVFRRRFATSDRSDAASGKSDVKPTNGIPFSREWYAKNDARFRAGYLAGILEETNLGFWKVAN